jgi:selenocysteine lyase/cysteine desulfurase
LCRWLYVPRGCAVFYVPVRNQHHVPSTLPTSHGFVPKQAKINSPLPKSSKSPFVANFEFVGTIDIAPYLCIPTALKWREELGGEEVVRNYCTTLVQSAAKHVSELLGTEVLDNKTGTLNQCAMANVRLPISVAKAQEVAAKSGLAKDEVGLVVRDWMCSVFLSDYGTFIQTFFYDGAWWGRLSGQVYLDMRDFEWAAQTLKTVCERVENGEWAMAESTP